MNMAETTKKTKKRATPKKVLDTTPQPEVMIKNKPIEKPKVKKIVLHEDDLVKVKSTYYGGLLYKGKKSGEIIRWNEPGEIQFMTIRELRAMKAEHPDFFRNKWIAIVGMVDEDSAVSVDDIYKALLLTKDGDFMFDPTDFDTINSWTEEEIRENVSKLTQGARNNLIISLNTFIEQGRLDSVKKIRIFEEVLGCELLQDFRG